MDIISLNEILNKNETRKNEFKGDEAFKDNFKAHLTFCIGAFANTSGGGNIIVGIKDGIPPEIIGVSEQNISSYDPTVINQYMKERLQPVPKFDIVILTHEDRKVIIINVKEFDDIPILVIKDIESPIKKYAKKAEILIRTESSECKRIDSPDDMRDLIQRSLIKRSDILLKDIKAIMTGEQKEYPVLPDEMFKNLLPDFDKDYDDFKNNDKNIFVWKLNFLPLPIIDDEIDFSELKNILKHSIVDHIPYKSFPLFFGFQDNMINLSNYIKLDVNQGTQRQFWHFNKKGAFGLAHVTWSEINSRESNFNYDMPPNRLIPKEEIICFVAEFFYFIYNIINRIECDDVYVNIEMYNINNRYLGSFQTGISNSGNKSHIQNYAKSKIFSKGEIITSWNKIAATIVKDIFDIFQSSEFNVDGILQLQKLYFKK